MIDAVERLRYLSSALGTGYLGNDGLNASFRCPKCQHKDKNKLVIKLDDEKWHCWVCGIKGRKVSSLLFKYAKESLQGWLQKFATSEQRKFIDEPIKEEVVELPEGFIPLTKSVSDPDYRAVIRYLDNRGIGEKEIWRYRIGTTLRGRTRRRAIITSYDVEGKLNYWTARAIDDGTVKYINPKIDRIDVIFNEIDVDWTKELTLVEGPFDLLSMGGNATCLLGSSLLQSHALFQRIVGNQTPIILALDSDVKKKTHNIAKLLFSHGINVKMLNTGDYKDVGEMSKEEIEEAKKIAQVWNPINRLHYLINTISSGSMF